MTELGIKHFEWPGPQEEGEEIRAHALQHLRGILDDLHEALVYAEKGEQGPP